MVITLGEQRRLEAFLSPREEMHEIIKKNVDDDTWEYLRNRGSLDCFHDKLVVPSKKGLYHNILLHKFVTADLDIPEMLTKITNFMR